MPRRALAALVLASATALTLTSCVANSPDQKAIAVAIADDSCQPALDTAPAGPVTFALTNDGSDVNEFEILAEDKLRIVGEKENLAPGQTVSYVAHLDPGTYYTACKFQQVGAPVGLAKFTVTGTAAARSADEQALAEEAVADYVAYVKSQAAELLPAVQRLADAYVAGDDESARTLYPAARVSYERIEPTAEAFGDLDPRLDYREVDAVAEGLDWTGFHRIEKDLWPPAAGDLNSDGQDALLDWAPSTPEQRQAIGTALVDDAGELLGLVSEKDFSLGLADISNGAIALLDEVAAGKITGEEDWWSSTDLWDFAANVEGAAVAFGNVRPLAEATGSDGADLADEIAGRFDELQGLLATYGSLDSGFVAYSEVDDGERRELSDAVNALAEPLSRLTSTVLGAAG